MALALCAALAAPVARAQSGKITVKILDLKGAPLLHASAQILETRQGAFSKDNGIATIINVAPSENYTVVAKYIGYVPDTLHHIKVQSDITTPLSVRLCTDSVCIVVTAEGPLVEKTKTDISTKYSPSTFAAMPGRQRIDQVIMLTPGAVQDNANGGISFHGSRGTDNSIRYNGIEITNPLTGRSGALQNSMSRLAISEIDVVTGSADASKGGFVGGEVNTQSRAGSSNLEVTAHFRTEIPGLFGYASNGFQQMGAGDNLYEFAIGGPLFSDDIKYFITARLNAFKYYNTTSDPFYDNLGLGVIDPAGNNLGQIPNTGRWRRSATGKLTFNALGFSISADAALANESDQNGGWGTLYLDPYYLNAETQVNNAYSVKAHGQIGDGVLELNMGYSVLNTQYGKYDHSLPIDATHVPHFLSVEDNYTYNESDQSITAKPDGIVDIYTPVTRQTPDPSDPTRSFGIALPAANPFTGHIEGGAISFSTANAYGLNQLFLVGGNYAGFFIENTGQSQFDAHYSVQIGSHFLDGGASGNFMSVYRYDNGLPWDANPFKDSFLVHPYTAAVYLTDKMEFSDITFAPGVRFDVFQSGAQQINNVYQPVQVNAQGVATGGTSPTALQTQISPRLAITYAVTDQTTFNFGYNWYFKQPNLNDVLTNTAGGNAQSIRLALIRGGNILGNGALAAQRTREVDVGFQTQLSDVFMFSLNGVYKDLRNSAGLQQISSPLLATGYTLFSDDQYGNDRSIEFIAEKRMSDNYSAKFTYTYQVAKGTSSSATENYSKLVNADPNSEQAVLPLQPFYFSYDKPHVAELLLNLNYNKGEGPTLFHTKLFQLFSLSTSTEYSSGVPYTSVDLKGGQLGAINGNREPDNFQTDATLTRTIPFEDILGETWKTVFLDLQLEVTNIFNRTTPLYVYATTGQGDNDGGTGLYGGSQEFSNNPTTGQLDLYGRLLYQPRLDLNHDGIVSRAEQQVAYTRYRNDIYARRTRPAVYQIPRRVYMNFTVRF
jgi:hypothetical protein